MLTRALCVGVVAVLIASSASAVAPPLLCPAEQCEAMLKDPVSWAAWGRFLKPGEWAQTSEIDVPEGDYAKDDSPPCRGNQQPSEILRGVVATVAAAAAKNPKVGAAAAAVITPYLDKELRKRGGEISFALAPDRSSSCGVVSVIVPHDAVVEEVFYEGYDKDRGGQCHPPHKCASGFSRFADVATTTKGANYQVVSAVFKNWDSDKVGTAKLIVRFRPPKGWKPQ
jgi:hypothetical protein